MTRQTMTFANPLTRALPLLAVTLWLQACGDGTGARPVGEAAAAAGTTLAAALVLQPLLDDDGHPMPSDPAAQPNDPGAQTRSQRYAINAQAEQLLHAMGERAVRVEAGCCGADAVDVAVGVVKGVLWQNALDADAPVMVYGADPRVASTIANRLGDEGMTRVWVVTR